jgi:hypothetical protein
MKKFFLVLSLLIGSGHLFAVKNDIIVDMTAGYRQDGVDFHYSAIDSATEHTKSGFFKADPLKIFELGLKLKYALDKHWYLRGFSDFGWVLTGRDKARTLFALSHSPASQSGNGGHALDFGGALGYTVFVIRTVTLAPIVGWGYERLKTDLSSQRTHIDNIRTVSHLKTSWNGPFIGLDLVYQPNIHFVVNGTYSLQMADQRITMKTSDTHQIQARSEWGALGNFFLLGLWYRCYSGWRFGLESSYLFYETFKEPHIRPTSQSPFYKDAKGDSFHWHSIQGLFSTSYDF